MIFKKTEHGSELPLDNLAIAAPCQASWSAMNGDERIRRCDLCQLNVYNISEMTKTEAEELINKSQGRLCVKFFRRKDGTIITNNCPIGLKHLKRTLYAKIAAIIAGAAVLAGITVKILPQPKELMGEIAPKSFGKAK